MIYNVYQTGFSLYELDVTSFVITSNELPINLSPECLEGYDKGVVTHVSSFQEYVDDLEQFVKKEVTPRARAEKLSGDESLITDDKFVYVANSMAGKGT